MPGTPGRWHDGKIGEENLVFGPKLDGLTVREHALKLRGEGRPASTHPQARNEFESDAVRQHAKPIRRQEATACSTPFIIVLTGPDGV